MSKTKQIIRLRQQKTPIKQIGKILGISKNTVKHYIELVSLSEFSCEELLKLEEHALEQSLLGKDTNPRQPDRYKSIQSDLDYFLHEHTTRKVTKRQLWLEYKGRYPLGYQYTQFCYHIQQYASVKEISMVMPHAPADALYIDFTGKKAKYVDKSSGEVIQAEIFVAILGFSKMGFVMAVRSQGTHDFIGALNDAVRFFGGVPRRVVCDNLKAGVVQYDRYEPTINQLLEDWANHHQTTIVPARAYKPKDKAHVENMVKQVYNRILAPVRDNIFFSLQEMNIALGKQLDIHHQEKFRKLDYSRKDLFMAQEKHLLGELPAEEFLIKKRSYATVGKNSYVTLRESANYYSVPYQYINQKVEIIYTPAMVYIYHKNILIAQHIRSFKKSEYKTEDTHLPSYMKHYLERSPEYYIEKAKAYGESFKEVFERIFDNGKHPEANYKTCNGLLLFARREPADKLIDICKNALQWNQCNYGFFKNAIKSYHKPQSPVEPLPNHQNIRGAQQFS